jgi:hypothetical protein
MLNFMNTPKENTVAYNQVQDIKQTADAICEDMGYDSYKEFEADDIEYVSMHCQCNYVDVCQILNIGLPESLELATVG